MSKMSDEPKFLIIDDDADVRDAFAIEIECAFGDVKIVEAEGVQAAMDLVKADQDFSAILCDLNLKDGTGFDFFKFLDDLNLEFPMILISGDDLSHYKAYQDVIETQKHFYYLKKPHKSEDLLNTLTEAINIEIKTYNNKFKKISIDRIRALKNIQIELYIKKAEDDYLKLTTAEDGHRDDLVEQYKAKGVTEFYTTTEEFVRYLDYVDTLFIKKLRNRALGRTQVIDVQLTSIEYIHQSMIDIGFKEAAVEIAKEAITSTINMLESDTKMADLLGDIIRNKNYKYQLSLLTSYIAVAVVQEMPWKSRMIQEKLCMAALLMDLSIDDERCRHFDLSKMEDHDLSKDEKEIVINHPEKSANIVKKFKATNNDIETLILQHHERPNEKGFPRQFPNKQFSPLSSLFILANDFAYRILKQPLTEKDLLDAVKYYDENFNVGNFKKAYEGFKISLKKRLNPKTA